MKTQSHPGLDPGSGIAAALCLSLAFAVHAQSPSDFRSSASLTPAAGDALQRFTLPFEAYRDARPDLADLRIFNAKGEAMPMAYASDPDPSREPPTATPLPMFPIYNAKPSRDVANVDVLVNTNRDGAVVSVRRNSRATTTERPVAWLLDASAVKTPMRYMTVDWNTGPGNELARVSVEGSDDLKYWSTITSGAPVLTVQQGGLQLAQRKIDLRGSRARYFRVTASPGTFDLRSVQVEPDVVTRPAARLTKTVPGSISSKPGQYVFDLGARIPVETVKLKFGETNSVAPFTLLARDDPAREGRHVIAATFYRLVREGVELESPPIEIGRLSARYWVARLDPRSPPPGGGAPTLEVQWRPAQVVFVARGEGPFTVAFGNPEVKPSVLQVSQLIPGYQPKEDLKLPQAQIAAVKTGEISGDWLRSLTGGANPRRVVLWLILGFAVIALTVMAWKLYMQMTNK